MNNRNTKLRKCQCGGELRLRRTRKIGRQGNAEYVAECYGSCQHVSDPAMRNALMDKYGETTQ